MQVSRGGEDRLSVEEVVADEENLAEASGGKRALYIDGSHRAVQLRFPCATFIAGCERQGVVFRAVFRVMVVDVQ